MVDIIQCLIFQGIEGIPVIIRFKTIKFVKYNE